MTRKEWIEQARELLKDNPKAEALLAVSFDAPKVPKVAEVEVVEAELVDEGNAVARIEPMTIKVPQRRASSGSRRGFMSRFGKAVGDAFEAADKAEEAELSGFDRLDVRAGQAAEKLLDKGMDAARSIPEKMPTLRDRGAAFRGRRLGRVKQS